MVRYATEHKQETRQRIIATAGRRLKRDGIDGSGVAVLMKDANLTNGAFYAHFASKDSLVTAVIEDQLQLLATSFAERLSPEDPVSARPKALSLLGMMAGMLQLSRALTDRELSDQLLEQGVRNALQLLESWR